MDVEYFFDGIAKIIVVCDLTHQLIEKALPSKYDLQNYLLRYKAIKVASCLASGSKLTGCKWYILFVSEHVKAGTIVRLSNNKENSVFCYTLFEKQLFDAEYVFHNRYRLRELDSNSKAIKNSGVGLFLFEKKALLHNRLRKIKARFFAELIDPNSLEDDFVFDEASFAKEISVWDEDNYFPTSEEEWNSLFEKIQDEYIESKREERLSKNGQTVWPQFPFRQYLWN